MKKLGLPILMLAGMICSALALAACKQGEGERCQVDDDCTSGFVCNQATSTCAKPGMGGIDADLPDDAPLPIDAPPIDAIDAPPDT